MIVTSESMGDAERHLDFEYLCRTLAGLPQAPPSTGQVVLIIRRGTVGRREAPAQSRLTPEAGVPGDAWIHRGQPDPAGQLAVMQAGVAELIANGQPLQLFGDNLCLDLDLSSANLPTGSRLRLGDALVEVTPKPHDGCRKFRARFGHDALRFVCNAELRHRNLRGIYMRVLEAGDVSVGAPVAVVSRG